MIDFLEHIDHQIILAINGWRSPFWDEIMWLISGKYTWIPLYFLLLFLAFRKLSTKAFIVFLIGTIVTVALADLISAQIIKEWVARYRPSHNLILENQLSYYKMSNGEFYQGGQYGFVSSHAANFFGIGTFIGLVLRPFYRKALGWLLVLAIVISYSRMYLGVHYMSDIIGGTILGVTIGYCTYRFIYKKVVE